MFNISLKTATHTKKIKIKTQSEERKQPPETDTAQMLLLSDGKFEITVINILRPLVKKEDDMEEQMVSVSS